MIVYTLTANIDEDLAEEWLQFMRNEVIHFVQETQLTLDYKMFKVLNDNEGVTYTFQFFFKDPLVYKLFLSEHHKYFAQLLNKYGHPKVAYFNTLLQQL
ncbi:MAG: DUF4286 family protein [Chitinophagales bacterium]